MTSDKLLLNADKTEVIVIETQHQLNKIQDKQLDVGDVSIESCTFCALFGSLA